VFTFEGAMPSVDGEQFRKLVEAFSKKAEHQWQNDSDLREALGNPDTGPKPARAVFRIDGLLDLCRLAARSGEAPDVGGDRPRVQVTMRLEDLQEAAKAARLAGGDDPAAVPAGALRQMLCDAGIIPVVLGSASEPLDVGREARLVTRPIRKALELRDRGCTFPHCDMPYELTEAHHIRPWTAGGDTRLSNMTLLCKHHHGLVEPPIDGSDPPWRPRIRSDGLVEYIPPGWLDLDRGPIMHQRFATGPLPIDLGPPGHEPPGRDPANPGPS
jgi:hypothetical protein